MDIAAVTIHARTTKDLSDVSARWETVQETVELRNKYGVSKDKTLIIGNGDVTSLHDARRRAEETGADGIMVGRGMFGNPWFFDCARKNPPTVEEKLNGAVEHAKLFEKLFIKSIVALSVMSACINFIFGI